MLGFSSLRYPIYSNTTVHSDSLIPESKMAFRFKLGERAFRGCGHQWRGRGRWRWPVRSR
jgi:hypothetical protein